MIIDRNSWHFKLFLMLNEYIFWGQNESFTKEYIKDFGMPEKISLCEYMRKFLV